MNSLKLSAIGVAVVALGLAACSGDSPTSANADVVTDSMVTADVAVSAGDEIASSVETLSADEVDASLEANADARVGSPNYALSVSRTRTCYDAAGAVVAGCKPLSSVRKIITHTATDGSRSVSNGTEGGNTVSWSGAAHRVADDTLSRTFDAASPPNEISRTHAGITVGHDTTAFASAQSTRDMSETFTDRILNVTWNVPRSSNPFPISGSITRSDTVHVVVIRGTTTKTRDTTRNVEVDFPADAQGNVVLKVNDKTCNLNLVTHAVSNCH